MKYITKIEYLEIKNVVSIYNTPAGVKLYIEPGAEFTPLAFSLGTAELSEKTKISGGSKLYIQELDYIFYSSKEDVAKYEYIEGKPLIIRYTYNDAEQRILGTKDYPVTLLLNLSVKDKTKYTVTGKCSNTYRSKIIIP